MSEHEKMGLCRLITVKWQNIEAYHIFTLKNESKFEQKIESINKENNNKKLLQAISK